MSKMQHRLDRHRGTHLSADRHWPDEAAAAKNMSNVLTAVPAKRRTTVR